MFLATSAGIGLAQDWVNPKTFDSTKGSWITWNGWGMQDTPEAMMLSHDPNLDFPNDTAQAPG